MLESRWCTCAALVDPSHQGRLGLYISDRPRRSAIRFHIAGGLKLSKGSRRCQLRDPRRRCTSREELLPTCMKGSGDQEDRSIRVLLERRAVRVLHGTMMAGKIWGTVPVL